MVVNIVSLDNSKGSILFESDLFAMTGEAIAEIIKQGDLEITYDQAFQMEDGLTIEQALDNLDLSYAEVNETEQDEFDVYLHEVRVRNGLVGVDVSGKFINSYKKHNPARNKALKLVNGLESRVKATQ